MILLPFFAGFFVATKYLQSKDQPSKPEEKQPTIKTEDYQNSVIWRKIQSANGDNANFEKEVKQLYNVNSTKEFVFALGDANAFKKVFLEPDFDINNFIFEIKQEMSSFAKDTVDAGFKYNYKIAKKFFLKKMKECKQILANQQLKLLITRNETDLVMFTPNDLFTNDTLHLAVGIGNVVLEWGRGLCGRSLVCPTKKSKLDKPVLSIDYRNDQLYDLPSEFFWNIKDYVVENSPINVEAAPNEKNETVKDNVEQNWMKMYQDYLSQVAEACVSFNNHKYYDPIHSNGQHFSHHLFQRVNVSMDLKENSGHSKPASLNDVVLEIVREGQCSFRFGERHLSTRGQLDKFVMDEVDFANLSDKEKRILFAYKSIYDFYHLLDANDTRMVTSDAAQKYWAYLVNTFYFVM